MRNYNSDFSSKPRYYTEYDQSTSSPQTTFPLEAKRLETTTDPTNSSRSLVKEVMCALGITITLIMGATWQLYHSVKAAPINSKITNSTKLSRKIFSGNKKNPLAISKSHQDIEMLMQKNAIANGKF